LRLDALIETNRTSSLKDKFAQFRRIPTGWAQRRPGVGVSAPTWRGG